MTISRMRLQRDASGEDGYGRLLRYVWLRRPGETGDVRVRPYPPDDALSLLFSSLQG